jgi:hypothetical protein
LNESLKNLADKGKEAAKSGAGAVQDMFTKAFESIKNLFGR